VLVEVCINLYVLFINRAAIRAVWRRVWPSIVGLCGGGARQLSPRLGCHPDWLKLALME